VICRVSVSSKYSTLIVVLPESAVEEGVVNGLPVCQENHPEISAIGLVDSAPKAYPAIHLDMFTKRVLNHALDPFLLDLPAIGPVGGCGGSIW
jgi:hypothetical protein